LSGDSSQEYLGDGVTDEIIAGIGRFPELTVLSRHASTPYQDKGDDMQRALGVRYVVDGNIARQNDRIRVTATLTDAQTSQLLWSQSYDQMFTDIFTVENNITRAIVGSLSIPLTRIEQSRSQRVPPENMNAYDLLLKGRALVYRANPSTNGEARTLFEQALKLDDKFAPAYASLGWTYYHEASNGWTEFTAGDSLSVAAELGLKAVALDPNLAEAHQLLGFVYLARREYQQAKDQTERALELKPSDPYSYATYAGILLWMGDAKGTIRAMETAVKFDPHLEWTFLYVLGFGYFLDQRYADAARVLEPIADASSDDYSAWLDSRRPMLNKVATMTPSVR
jgi:TolB-like protein